MSDALAVAQQSALDRVNSLETRDAVRTPSLWFDQKAIEHNIDAMLARVQDPARWQPHIKTHKCKAVVKLCIARGVRHFKCATLSELCTIANAAAELNVKVKACCSYPFYEAQWTHAKSLATSLSSICVTWLVDSPEHFEHLRAHDGPDAQLRRKLALDVDTGMHRSGTPVSDWIPFLEQQAGALQASGYQINILHGYEGHLGWSEQAKAHAGYDELLQLDALCTNLGFAPAIVTSGSHSYAHALTHPGLTKLGPRARVSPGTIVLNDLNSPEATQDLGLHYGALVASRVISVAHGRMTLDAGSKALSPDVQDNIASIVGHPQWQSKFQHEEHLVMQGGTNAHRFKPGDIVWLVPSHVCTTVNLYGRANLLSPGRERSTVAIASGHPWAQEQPAPESEQSPS